MQPFADFRNAESALSGGVAVANDSNSSTCSRPQRRNTKEISYPYSPLWQRERAWLPWQSNDQEHGLKAHRVTPGGHIEVAEDNPIIRRKKIKGVSSRQWER